MEKSCSNCEWKWSGERHCFFNHNKVKENVCKHHRPKCMYCNELADYEWKFGSETDVLCLRHVLDIAGVEQHTVYTLDNKILGFVNDIDEVIKNLEKDIKKIEWR